ncbi:MAG: hypothetical protein OEN21_06155 [Myxococcales bacterium]|nr:hypothetical protein [Myxococcales bacterium]
MSKPALYTQGFTEAEERQQLRNNICAVQGAAGIILKKAGFQMLVRGAGHVVNHDVCFLDKEHAVDLSSEIAPDFQRMVLRGGGSYLWCPIGNHKITAPQLLNVLPLGKRKNAKNADTLLRKFNCRPVLKRLYVFESGDNFEEQSADADASTALEAVRPSPKTRLRGVLIEAPSLRQAREILEAKRDELPWKELHGKLRSDQTLNANWHDAPLTLQEKTTLRTQEMEAMHDARRARAKLVSQLRREANSLSIEPL